jgi:hypothetical protein
MVGKAWSTFDRGVLTLHTNQPWAHDVKVKHLIWTVFEQMAFVG